MPNKSKYAKIGDEVVVIVPKAFIRCGYRVDSDFLRDKYPAEINRRVFQAREAAKLPRDDKKVTSALEQAVILGMMREKEFGGRERIIIERDFRDPEIRKNYWIQTHTGQVMTVTGKKMVVTGTYKPGYDSYSYWENEWDGEYPSLENKQHHMVYKSHFFEILAKHTISIQQWRVIKAIQIDEERKESEMRKKLWDVQCQLDKFGGKNVFTSF